MPRIFPAAGNEARLSAESPFRASGVIVSGSWELHDFDLGSGVDVTQKVFVPVGHGFNVVFQWEDPFFTWAPGSGGATRDFDIALLDKTENYVLGWSLITTSAGTPSRCLDSYNDGSFDFDGDSIADTEFNFVLMHYAGPTIPAPLLKTVIFPIGSFTFAEWDTQSGTSYGHANATGASAVGAAFYAATPPTGSVHRC